jgi:hypothetical protein
LRYEIVSGAMKLCPSIEFWLGQDIIVSYVKVSPGHYFIEIAI